MDLLRLGFVALEIRKSSLDADSLTDNLEETKKQTTNDYRTKNRDEKRLKIITLDEVAWHDSADDCWIAIYDYVYDCTNFIKKHPGGQEVLAEYGGRDATLSFIGSGHTKVAFSLLDQYLIGELPVSERLYRKTGGVQIVALY